jgi:hypothetical protein
LKIRFSRLYSICEQQFWEVSRVLRGGGINLTFRRNFNTSEMGEWDDLESELEGGDVAGSYAFEGEIFCLVGAKK